MPAATRPASAHPSQARRGLAKPRHTRTRSLSTHRNRPLRRQRRHAERTQVVDQPPHIALPVVSAQLAPGALADLVERRGQLARGWRRVETVAEQRNDLRVRFERIGEFAPHRVIGVVDAQAADSVGGRQQLRRHQQQRHRALVEQLLHLVAPARAAAQVVLVEKHLGIAEGRDEVARQRRGRVLAVAAAVADEDARCHGAAV